MMQTVPPPIRMLLPALAVIGALALTAGVGRAAEPIHVTYLWHMHQPIYYPYESVQETDNNGRYSFSVAGVHNDRAPNYTTWPRDAIQQGHDRGMPHAGAQSSFSGSLMENLNGLWGRSTSATWDDPWDWARNNLRTTLNNPRLDMVGFAYHHSLMPLTSPKSRRMQIKLHKEIYSETWDTGGGYSKGFFPPETAFANWMIPSLLSNGIEWVLVDNIHFDRACEGYPWDAAGSVYRPNRADIQNPEPAHWLQLNNVWAPTKVSAPFGYQPHYVQYVDPWSPATNPAVSRIIAVPAARYEGNENSRGAYGAFKPENVWTEHINVNTDPDHPMIMVCHSDGDNFGMKNADAWNGQHSLFLDMIQSDANFAHSTVQDYLDQYPPDPSDVIHVEPGSWAGADAGDPEFKKWLADPWNDGSGQNPDRYSWSVLIAAQNRVLHADDLENSYSMNDVRWDIGPDTARAWHHYLNAEASDYWYWDTDDVNPWNANVTRASNLAVEEADKVLARHPGVDNTPPSIFPPQREPYNPGGYEWNETEPQPSDFEVLSYVDDASGLAAVTLYWRTDKDGNNPISSYDNELYEGGAEVNAWNTQAMAGDFIPANKGPGPVPDPTYRAKTYTATVSGQSEVLIDYFIEAVDNEGNTARSDIMHVYVGQATGGSAVTFTPPAPQDCDELVTAYDPTGRPLDGAANVYQSITFDGWTTSNRVAMSQRVDGTWSTTSAIPDGAASAEVAFDDGAGTRDDNSAANWSVAISECVILSSASFDPAAPDGCTPVTITYDPGTGDLENANPVYIHVGRNNWQDVSDPAMTDNGDGTWSYVYNVPAGTFRIDSVFHDGSNTWDNNLGSDWQVNVANCPSAFTQTVGFAHGSPVVTADPATPADQNNIGDNFDFNTAGGAASTEATGGFGSFGNVYFNYDETNLYVGAHGAEVAGPNNAMVLFLDLNTLERDAANLWDLNGAPLGLDFLHNVAFVTPMDLALVMGDEYGDGTYPSFNLESGYDFGQGAFHLGDTSFVAVAGATLSQFDGTNTTAVMTNDWDGDRLVERWEVCIPWSSLNATNVGDVTRCRVAGLLVNDSVTNQDRYISGNYLGEQATSGSGKDAFNNFGFNFVSLTAMEVDLLGADSDGDFMPDVWESLNNLQPHDPSDAEEDGDGDGFRNRHEYFADTHPGDGQSLLQARAVRMVPGQGPQVHWLSRDGKVYSVWMSTNLQQGFQQVQASVPSAPPTNVWTHVGGPTNGPVYYRIGVEP